MSELSSAFIDKVEAAIARNDRATLDDMAARYFEAAPTGPSPFSAAVRLSPEGERAVLAGPQPLELPPVAESALMLNAANFVERARRLVDYNTTLLKDPSALRIVAEGDSWFQYPFRLYDIIDVLKERYAVKCLSAAGDTVADMVRSAEYIEAIAAERPAFFVFSGGGNDLVGDGRMRQILKPYKQGLKGADLINEDAFARILNEVMSGYTTIVDRVRQNFPGLRMLGHGYDHPRNIAVGPWIKPYLDEKGIPLETGLGVVAALLGAFGERLEQLAAEQQNFVYVPVVGCVGSRPSDWYDALHPNDPGYRRVADKFIAKIEGLRQTLPAEEEISSRTYGIYRESLAVETKGEVRKAIKAVYSLPNFGYPRWADFGPEGNWRNFEPETIRHIRDVISLLERVEEREDHELVGNRVAVQRDGSGNREAFPEALDDVAIAEAIIGGNDLEDVQSLLIGYRSARAVGLIARASPSMRAPRASGFLVGRGLVLTNHHVFNTDNDARQHVIVMDDERDLTGRYLPTRTFKITGLYLADPRLDFAFASVAETSADGASLDGYGSLALEGLAGKAIKGESLVIVQHPDGQPKKVSIRNSYAMGRIDEGFYYTADTRPGSSGSVVFNCDWQVVALHHEAVPHPTLENEYIANRGIRISSIMDRLRELADGGSAKARTVLDLIAAPRDPSSFDIAPAAQPPAGPTRRPATSAEAALRSAIGKNDAVTASVAKAGPKAEKSAGRRKAKVDAGRPETKHKPSSKRPTKSK